MAGLSHRKPRHHLNRNRSRCRTAQAQCRRSLRKGPSGACATPVPAPRPAAHILSSIGVIPNRSPRSSMMRLKIWMFAQWSQCSETHGWPVPSGSELSSANCWSKLRFLQSVQLFLPHAGHFCGTPRFPSAAQTASFCSLESGTQSRYQIRAGAGGLPGFTPALSGSARRRRHRLRRSPRGGPSDISGSRGSGIRMSSPTASTSPAVAVARSFVAVTRVWHPVASCEPFTAAPRLDARATMPARWPGSCAMAPMFRFGAWSGLRWPETGVGREPWPASTKIPLRWPLRLDAKR